MSDDGTTVTMKDGVTFGAGSSADPNSLDADTKGQTAYYTSAATSGEVYSRYTKMVGTGAGAEFIAGRDRTVLEAAAGNAHGAHDSLEVTSTGYVTGLGTALRANVIVSDTVVPQGTYYGVLAEIYPAGNTSALPASNACLCCQAVAGTAMDSVANAIAFNGTDGSGKMIYTNNDSDTAVGSIRITVNGAAKYLRFYAAQA